MNQQGIARFEEGVNVLLLSQPFYGTLLMKLRHVADESVPTLCVNGRELRYNPDFMAKQNMEQAQFCVAHEVNHMAWLHLLRLHHYLERGVGPDGKPLDQLLFNKALDFPNNASLVESKIGEVPAGIEICLDLKRFPSSMTPEEVYCILKEEQDKNPQQCSGGGGGKGQPGGSGQPLDSHEPLDPSEPDQPITAADVQQAANVCKAMRGSLPAGMDRLLGEIQRPDASPWRVLRQAVTTSLSGYDASSWRKLQRKMITRGIGVPGRVAQGAGTVGVVVDTSGSIGDQMLQLFGGHMAAIMGDARPEKVHVLWVDAKVHRVDEVKSPTDLRRVLSGKVPGGGGTDMRKGVRQCEELRCDVIVVLTDGDTPYCDSKIPTYWAITNRSNRSPYGKTVYID